MPANVDTQPVSATPDTAELLERARRRLGWSQWRCAAELGIGVRTWQRWESGDAPAQLGRVRACAALWRAFLVEAGDVPEQEAA